MLLTIERVALLRKVDLFANTPDRVLAGVAQVLEEVEFAAGDTVIDDGAVEDWLFIVVDGELEVITAGRRIVIPVGASSGSWRFSIRSPGRPKVIARTPALLFRLRKPAFDEVMATRPEIARGVVLELVRRLRERPTDLATAEIG